MLDLVVVLRAEDAVLDFLSVLTDPDGDGVREGEAPREIRVLCCDTGQWIALPPDGTPYDRLELLAPHLRAPDAPAASPGPKVLAALLTGAAEGRPARIWTHSPADNRRSRGRLGRDVAAAAHGLPVHHAVGYSPYLQFVSDEDRPLGRALVAAKLGFVNRHCGPLLSSDSPEFMVYTARVPATERFFAAGDPREREGLFALLASLDEEAATVADPWEFDSSAYERSRLDATTAWVARHRLPGDGPLVEVGACEGALTARLAAKGYAVDATEPNPLFRDRLTARTETVPEGVRVHPYDLAELADRSREPGLAGTAYLLIEMLYYGQDPALLDDLPTDLVLLALEPATLDERVRPWLAATSRWETVEETVLVAPALEPVCGGRAYLSKRGSVGLALRRTEPTTRDS
ncbi:SAM-dependent methyltransferase [Streptomyces sp. NPDC004111]|uniref:SAM-dependent methyltransferase n=1 Tax=Streptomyces sp. NPDC004111 TaxID=3364690 RepID=UPI0036B38228